MRNSGLNQKIFTMFILAFAIVDFVNADTIYWNGVGTSWGTVANWSLSPSATTPNPSAVPSSMDEAIFSITGASTPQTILLNANQAVSKLSFLADSTINGGNANQTLEIGTGGIELASGANAVIIGSTVDGQKVDLSLKGNQVWTNAAANPLEVNNDIDNAAKTTLTLKGSGGYVLKGNIADGTGVTTFEIADSATVELRGSNTYSGGTKTAGGATLVIANNSALGTGLIETGGGTVRADGPQTIANKVRLANGGANWSGTGPLTFTGDDGNPAVAVRQYANPAYNIAGPAPQIVSGSFSLCDTTSSLNNGARGPKFMSGGDMWISGEVIDYNSGNASSNINNKGMGIVFYGTGANLTLTGTNDFGAGSTVSTSIIVNKDAGYNTITVGGPGGAGATITPFGDNKIYSNSEQPFFIKALENNQILGNGISMGPSVNNGSATPIGFVGTNSMTLTGPFSLAITSRTALFANLASGTFTFADLIHTGTGNSLTIYGSGNTIFSSTSTLTGNGIAKTGTGTLTFSGVNNLTNATSKTTLSGGRAVLDYSSDNANRLAQGTGSDALTLDGVDLQLNGGSYAQTLGTGGTTIIGGQNKISQTGGGSSTIALGEITRIKNDGGVIDVQAGAASTTTTDENGILGGGYATVDGTDWAVGNGVISAFNAYDSFVNLGDDKNILQTDSASAAGINIGSLKIDTTTSGQSLTITGSNAMTLYRRGLLFTGSDDYTITGGKIRGNISYLEGLLIHQYGTGILTIESEIANGSASALVKAGPGELVIANSANTYSGTAFLFDGMLTVSESGNLGAATSKLNFNGGTLRATAGFDNGRAIAMNSNGGTVQVDAGTLEFSGIISGTGDLKKTGEGELLLSGENTYSGFTTISAGTLKLGSSTALGYAATSRNRSISPVIVDGTGSLDIAGQTTAIGNFTLKDGALTDSVGGGTLAAYSFNIENGTVDAVLKDVVVPAAANTINTINLYKTTTGSATINSTSIYTGGTFVKGGSLFINGELTESPAYVYSDGTLLGDGTIQNSIFVDGGTIAPSISAAEAGSLTVGKNLYIYNTGTFNVIIGSTECGKVVMTAADAMVNLNNADISVSALPGASFTDLTIIDNQGDNDIQGTFNGLPEGSKFISNGRSYTITYQGGDGNDVVLTMNAQGTLLIIQ